MIVLQHSPTHALRRRPERRQTASTAGADDYTLLNTTVTIPAGSTTGYVA